MTRIFSFIALFFFGVGLWQHDWRVIVGSIVLLLAGILLGEEARTSEVRRRERARLDRLWDDDDLSDSA